MAGGPTAAPDTKQQHDRKFYAAGIPILLGLMREILTEYSKIAEDDLIPHIQSLRDQAYGIYHYPCIGSYRFLTFSLCNHDLYRTHVLPHLLSNLDPKEGGQDPLFLDIGTCFGQDLRALLHAGVPSSRIYATDIEAAFPALGYAFFRDHDRFPSTHQLVPVDLFDFTSTNPLTNFFTKNAAELPDHAPGRAPTIIHAAAIFHLFSREDQVIIARRLLRLLRRTPGSLILGSHTAHTHGKAYPQRPGGRGDTLYRHGAKSWTKMWEAVAREVFATDEVSGDGGGGNADEHSASKQTRFTVKVEANLNDNQEPLQWEGGRKVEDVIAADRQADPEFRWMKFAVWIVDADSNEQLL